MSRWNGVVGHTLYGDVDIGMSNIDITHSRYSQAVDYSAFIRSVKLIWTFSLISDFLLASHRLFSPNEARILSRKPGPSSRLFILLKPFPPLLWALLALVFFLFFFLILAFKRMNEKYFGLRTESKDFVWLFTGVGGPAVRSTWWTCRMFQLLHVILRPGSLISPAWPRSSQYLYLTFEIFFYFMLHFFYLVNVTFIPQHFLLNQRAFFIHFWWESRMKLQWTLLRTLSRDPVTTFIELTSAEVRRRTTTILSSDFTLQAELSKSFSQLQKIPSTRRSMKWPGIKTTGAQFVYLFNDKMLTATIPCKGALLRARWTYTGNKTRRL